MRWFWRLGLVGAIAVASFFPALGRFSAAAEKSCAQQVRQDTAYQVRFDQRPRTNVSSYHIIVTKNDNQPVTGARICVNSYMVGMSAMAVTDIGKETFPGSYEVRLTFEMGDKWAGQVIVAEPGKPQVSIPVVLDVVDTWGMSPGAMG